MHFIILYTAACSATVSDTRLTDLSTCANEPPQRRRQTRITQRHHRIADGTVGITLGQSWESSTNVLTAPQATHRPHNFSPP